MAISVFKRYEKKFILNSEQYRKTVAFVQQYMDFDKYCVGEKDYSLLNLYFDTPENELIMRSTAKPDFKEKLRLRAYFPPKTHDDKVFFEIKRKYKGIVTKRRAVMKYGEALELIDTGKAPKLSKDTYIDTQVAKEIEYMFERYKGLAPAVYIAYDRVAMFAKDNPEFRLTFDRNIRTRRDNVSFDYGDYGTQLLPEGYNLMEIKISDAVPLWLATYLSENKLYMTGFSKYGKEYEGLVTGLSPAEKLLASDDV
ncbi:MAG: polyphosphate polymerase domain-containing protein [Clostridia bacterium]|nr:polyphosphate polymerase domain-containing protein [Clostridia bacterium]MBQ9749055.1 polyphosphate polymerase domain-containing protein [Clostridia bacterium]